MPTQHLPALHAYLATAVRGLRCVAHRVGGIEDHAHLCIGLDANVSIAQLVRHVKANSSRWLKQEFAHQMDGFSWQRGYAAFSVDPTHIDGVIGYVFNQRVHHHGKDYKHELEGLLRRAGVEFCARQLWGADDESKAEN